MLFIEPNPDLFIQAIAFQSTSITYLDDGFICLQYIFRALYCSKPVYQVTKRDILWYRWLAPEVITHKIHGSPADVWSFGTVHYTNYNVEQC